MQDTFKGHVERTKQLIKQTRENKVVGIRWVFRRVFGNSNFVEIQDTPESIYLIQT